MPERAAAETLLTLEAAEPAASEMPVSASIDWTVEEARTAEPIDAMPA